MTVSGNLSTWTLWLHSNLPELRPDANELLGTHLRVLRICMNILDVRRGDTRWRYSQ